jgi:hypothetical protein
VCVWKGGVEGLSGIQATGRGPALSQVLKQYKRWPGPGVLGAAASWARLRSLRYGAHLVPTDASLPLT